MVNKLLELKQLISQLDELKLINSSKKKSIFEDLNIENLNKYLLVVYHSVTEEFYNTEKNFNIF